MLVHSPAANIAGHAHQSVAYQLHANHVIVLLTTSHFVCACTAVLYPHACTATAQDYGAILAQAQEEADVVLWDGGNNDTPFYKPGVRIERICM